MLALVMALALTSSAAGAAGVVDSGASERYIVVLKAKTAAAGAEVADAVRAAGGTIEATLPNRLVVSIPGEARQTLSAHKGVKYLQKIHSEIEVEPEGTIAAHDTGSGSISIQPLHGQHWSSGTYSYDGAGNVGRIGTAAAPGTQGYRTYGYDNRSRLVSAEVGGVVPAVTYGFQYDDYGNRTSSSVNGQSTSVPVSSSTNRLTTATYDAAGNQLALGSTEGVWDGFGMMTRYEFDNVNAQAYVYTAGDERIGVLRGSEWTWTLRGSDGKALRQYSSSHANPQAPWLWVEDFSYRDGVLIGADRETLEGGRRHFHVDHLGTPRLVTSRFGALISEHDLLPFGAERTSIPQHTSRGYDREEPLRFTGHERDFEHAEPNNSSAYIDYMHARFYAPNMGRFLSVDPVLDTKRSLREPQSWNRYSYVVNNPINRIDPDGRVDQNWDGNAARQLFPDDRASQLEFDQNVAERTAFASALTVGGIGGWAARGVLATAALSPRLALAAASVLGGMAGQPTFGGIQSAVMPGGAKIGVAGTSTAIRFVQGGFKEANAMFQSLAKGGKIVHFGKGVLTVDLKGVGQVTLRTVSSGDGVQATVQLNVKGVGIREIKYVDELRK